MVSVVCSVVSSDETTETDLYEEVEVEVAVFNGQPMGSVVRGKLLNRGRGGDNHTLLSVARATPQAAG